MSIFLNEFKLYCELLKNKINNNLSDKNTQRERKNNIRAVLRPTYNINEWNINGTVDSSIISLNYI